MNEPEWIKRIKKYHFLGKPSLHEGTQNLIGVFISTTYWQVNLVVNKILFGMLMRSNSTNLYYCLHSGIDQPDPPIALEHTAPPGCLKIGQGLGSDSLIGIFPCRFKFS